jgi:hypothetical protein
MKKLLGILSILFFFGCSNQSPKESGIDIKTHVSQQLDYAIQLAEPLKDSVKFSPRTIENGELKLVRSQDGPAVFSLEICGWLMN